MIVYQAIRSVVYIKIRMVIDRIKSHVLLGENILSLAFTNELIGNLARLLLKIIVLVISEFNC